MTEIRPMAPRAVASSASTVRDVVIQFLRDQGIDRVFGNPGSTELPMFADLPEGFGYVLGLQESVVVAMADGHAQATRRPAFVNLHSAAGLGHAMGAVLAAYRNGTPLVITTGQQSRHLLPHDPFLFAENAVDLPKPYVKWAIEPARAEDVPAAIARAFHIAQCAPMGPVLVSVPLDDWSAPARALPVRQVTGRTAPDPQALAALRADLDMARAPALVVGQGVDIDGGWYAVLALAERLQSPVWAAPLAARCGFPEDHPLFGGFLPAAQPAISDCLAGSDLVLVLGAPVFNYHYGTLPRHLPQGARLWLVTSDAKQAAGGATGDALLADCRLAAEALLPGLAQRADRPAQRQVAPVACPAGITPEWFYQTLAAARDPQSIVVEEAPSARGALHDHFPITRPGGFFATSSGGLGYGLPAAVGVALSQPGPPTIAIIGDGSSLYSIQALWSAVEYGADLLVIILNNGGYAALRDFAASVQARRITGIDIGHMDFVALATAQGCPARRVRAGAELDATLREMLAETGPRLLDVILSTEEMTK